MAAKAFKGELQWFILRSSVRQLYRDALRVVRGLAAEHAAPELRREIRSRFDQHAELADTAVIRRLLADGRKELDMLEAMLRSGRGA